MNDTGKMPERLRTVLRQRRQQYVVGIGLVLLISLSALLAFVSTHGTRAQAKANDAQDTSANRCIGANVSGVWPFDVSRTFADAVRQAHPHWDTADHPGDAAAPEDANGWPTSDASLLLWEGMTNFNGTYKVIFNGQADISAAYGYATIANQTYDQSSNTTTADMIVTDTGFENFSIIFRNTRRTPSSPLNSGITNLKVMRPPTPGASTSLSPSTTFTPAYEQLLSRFCVLRFLDFIGANGNTDVNWSDRPLPSAWNQIGHVAWEYAIQLANETGKDMYINIPGSATGSDPNDTTSYVYQLAKLIRDGDTVNGVYYPGLNPNLHVYIEYSNEVWNFMFKQAGDNRDAAIAEVNAGNSPLNFDGSTNQYVWAWRRIGKRIKEISAIFRAVFGDSQMLTRVRPVLEYQYNNYQGTADTEMRFLDDYYNNADGKNHVANPHPLNYYLWGAGGATYYNGTNDNASTVDGIYSGQIPSPDWPGVTQGEAAWAKSYGLHDIAYEGGYAIGGDSPTAVTNAARFDPRAGPTLVTAQTIFDQAGGDVNILYYLDGTRNGMTDSVYHQNTPLLQAIDQLDQAPPAAQTQGIPINGSTQLSPTSPTLRNSCDASVSPVFNNNSDCFLAYMLLVNAPGTYQIALTAGNSGPGGQFRVEIDGNTLTTITTPNTGSTTAFQPVDGGTVTLSAGPHTLRLKPIVNTTQGGNSAGRIGSIILQSGSGGITPIPTNTPTPTPGNTPTPTPTSTPISGGGSVSLTNPGFETPNLGNGGWQYNPTGASWTFSPSSGISNNGSSFTSGAPNAPEGSQVGFIQNTGSISQAVNFPAGTYTVSFQATQRVNSQSSSQNFQVLLDGQSVGSFTPTTGSYNSYTTNSFTVGAGNHTLQFQGLNSNGGDNTTFIDAVSINGGSGGSTPTPTPSPTPVPTNTPTPTPTGTPTGGNGTLSNAGFETPNLGNGGWQYNPTGASWTFTPSGPGSNGYPQGSGISNNGSSFTSGAPNAPEGSQVAFLQGTGSISQSVTLAGGSHVISFQATQRVNSQSSSEDFQVLIDGQVVGTFRPGSGSYNSYTTNSFVVTAGTHTVQFQGLDSNGGDNTAFIDAVSIN